MAKVNAPLFSFGASGKLADSLVFSKWKGLPTVRQWLTPANPNTAAQSAQRTKMSDAVDQWHSASLTAGDIAAWNSLAAIASSVMSGFNQFVQYYINIINAGDAYKLLFGGSAVPGAAGVITATIDSADEVSGVKAWYGTKKTGLLSSVDLAFAAGVWSGSITGLVSGDRYYVQFQQLAAGVEGISGIFESLAG